MKGKFHIYVGIYNMKSNTHTHIYTCAHTHLFH